MLSPEDILRVVQAVEAAVKPLVQDIVADEVRQQLTDLVRFQEARKTMQKATPA